MESHASASVYLPSSMVLARLQRQGVATPAATPLTVAQQRSPAAATTAVSSTSLSLPRNARQLGSAEGSKTTRPKHAVSPTFTPLSSGAAIDDNVPAASSQTSVVAKERSGGSAALGGTTTAQVMKGLPGLPPQAYSPSFLSPRTLRAPTEMTVSSPAPPRGNHHDNGSSTPPMQGSGTPSVGAATATTAGPPSCASSSIWLIPKDEFEYIFSTLTWNVDLLRLLIPHGSGPLRLPPAAQPASAAVIPPSSHGEEAPVWPTSAPRERGSPTRNDGPVAATDARAIASSSPSAWPPPNSTSVPPLTWSEHLFRRPTHECPPRPGDHSSSPPAPTPVTESSSERCRVPVPSPLPSTQTHPQPQQQTSPSSFCSIAAPVAGGDSTGPPGTTAAANGSIFDTHYVPSIEEYHRHLEEEQHLRLLQERQRQWQAQQPTLSATRLQQHLRRLRLLLLLPGQEEEEEGEATGAGEEERGGKDPHEEEESQLPNRGASRLPTRQRRTPQNRTFVYSRTPSTRSMVTAATTVATTMAVAAGEEAAAKGMPSDVEDVRRDEEDEEEALGVLMGRPRTSVQPGPNAAPPSSTTWLLPALDGEGGCAAAKGRGIPYALSSPSPPPSPSVTHLTRQHSQVIPCVQPRNPWPRHTRHTSIPSPSATREAGGVVGPTPREGEERMAEAFGNEHPTRSAVPPPSLQTAPWCAPSPASASLKATADGLGASLSPSSVRSSPSPLLLSHGDRRRTRQEGRDGVIVDVADSHGDEETGRRASNGLDRYQRRRPSSLLASPSVSVTSTLQPAVWPSSSNTLCSVAAGACGTPQTSRLNSLSYFEGSSSCCSAVSNLSCSHSTSLSRRWLSTRRGRRRAACARRPCALRVYVPSVTEGPRASSLYAAPTAKALELLRHLQRRAPEAAAVVDDAARGAASSFFSSTVMSRPLPAPADTASSPPRPSTFAEAARSVKHIERRKSGVGTRSGVPSTAPPCGPMGKAETFNAAEERPCRAQRTTPSWGGSCTPVELPSWVRERPLSALYYQPWALEMLARYEAAQHERFTQDSRCPSMNGAEATAASVGGETRDSDEEEEEEAHEMDRHGDGNTLLNVSASLSPVSAPATMASRHVPQLSTASLGVCCTPRGQASGRPAATRTSAAQAGSATAPRTNAPPLSWAAVLRQSPSTLPCPGSGTTATIRLAPRITTTTTMNNSVSVAAPAGVASSSTTPSVAVATIAPIVPEFPEELRVAEEWDAWEEVFYFSAEVLDAPRPPYSSMPASAPASGAASKEKGSDASTGKTAVSGSAMTIHTSDAAAAAAPLSQCRQLRRRSRAAYPSDKARSSTARCAGATSAADELRFRRQDGDTGKGENTDLPPDSSGTGTAATPATSASMVKTDSATDVAAGSGPWRGIRALPPGQRPSLHNDSRRGATVSGKTVVSPAVAAEEAAATTEVPSKIMTRTDDATTTTTAAVVHADFFLQKFFRAVLVLVIAQVRLLGQHARQMDELAISARGGGDEGWRHAVTCPSGAFQLERLTSMGAPPLPPPLSGSSSPYGVVPLGRTTADRDGGDGETRGAQRRDAESAAAAVVRYDWKGDALGLNKVERSALAFVRRYVADYRHLITTYVMRDAREVARRSAQAILAVPQAATATSTAGGREKWQPVSAAFTLPPPSSPELTEPLLNCDALSRCLNAEQINRDYDAMVSKAEEEATRTQMMLGCPYASASELRENSLDDVEALHTAQLYISGKDAAWQPLLLELLQVSRVVQCYSDGPASSTAPPVTARATATVMGAAAAVTTPQQRILANLERFVAQATLPVLHHAGGEGPTPPSPPLATPEASMATAVATPLRKSSMEGNALQLTPEQEAAVAAMQDESDAFRTYLLDGYVWLSETSESSHDVAPPCAAAPYAVASAPSPFPSSAALLPQPPPDRLRSPMGGAPSWSPSPLGTASVLPQHPASRDGLPLSTSRGSLLQPLTWYPYAFMPGCADPYADGARPTGSRASPTRVYSASSMTLHVAMLPLSGRLLWRWVLPAEDVDTFNLSVFFQSSLFSFMQGGPLPLPSAAAAASPSSPPPWLTWPPTLATCIDAQLHQDALLNTWGGVRPPCTCGAASCGGDTGRFEARPRELSGVVRGRGGLAPEVTLVHCSAGMHRSCGILVAFLLWLLSQCRQVLLTERALQPWREGRGEGGASPTADVAALAAALLLPVEEAATCTGIEGKVVGGGGELPRCTTAMSSSNCSAVTAAAAAEEEEEEEEGVPWLTSRLLKRVLRHVQQQRRIATPIRSVLYLLQSFAQELGLP